MERSLPNSEILLIYEAKMCNPNGDPDAENRPRIDPKTNINLVSDVRLKRFFRDYIVEKYGEEYVYVTKIGGVSVKADDRLKELLKALNIAKSDELEQHAREVLRLIDARLFGATVPIRGKERGERGATASFTGPVQFTWGFSFHPVELVESSTITSVFSGREAAERYGTMGKDWRVYYSLIGFYGVVSGRRARVTGMTEEDLKVFDNLVWTALQVQPTTRSKIGERPHLYLRVEYGDADTLLGDLRKFVEVRVRDGVMGVRDFEDLCVEFGKLVDYLSGKNDLISKIYIRTSDELANLKELIRGRFPGKLVELPHKLEEEKIEAIIKGPLAAKGEKGGRRGERVSPA